MHIAPRDFLEVTGSAVELRSAEVHSFLITGTMQTAQAASKPIITNENQTMSYATMLKEKVYPTREQAIILDSIENLTIQDYAEGISKLTDPLNITHISRISKNRVCLYLRSKKIVDELTDVHRHAKIGQHKLEIRPLIVKTKRVILSNVGPDVPDEMIIEGLTQYHKSLQLKRLSAAQNSRTS